MKSVRKQEGVVGNDGRLYECFSRNLSLVVENFLSLSLNMGIGGGGLVGGGVCVAVE